MMLSVLPVEILLEIIQFMPFTTIASLSTLSKSWATLMDTNESSIYHSISKRHGYVPKDDSGGTAPPEGWKAWFVQKIQIELRWIGKLPGHSYRVRVPGTTGNFHRIKVDEEAGYVINTFTNGGLVVSDINDHSILWSLDEEFCSPFVHCEHDEGYIVFNRMDNYKEVWRRRIDVLDIPEEAWPSGLYNKPDEDMIKGNLVAEDRYLDTNRSRDPDHLRGQFVPWARLQIPEDGRAFKLTRGTLLVSSVQKAFLYDVEKAELQQTIELQPFGSGRLRYVDISDQHVFIVSTLQLDVYDRANGSRVLTIPAGRLPWNFYASPENQWRRTEETFNDGELGFRRAAPPNWADREDYFHAAHVSCCGKHLAIMTMSNRIILVQDFWRLFPTLSSSSPPTLIPSPITLQHISKQVDFYTERPLLEAEGYLAYYRGKVAGVGIHGVYVLVLDSILDQLGEIELLPKDVSLQNLQTKSPEREPSWPNLRLREVEFDLEMFNAEIISCLQLTETKLYLSVLSDDIMDDRGENMWCCDFASSPSLSTRDLPAGGDWDAEDSWDWDAGGGWGTEGDWDEVEARLAGDRRRSGGW
ncbi:hypothetical protein BDM02DRAFT_3176644 [Thelephora ganbajun]|uniref:Uncharacterized protein n=1 Tax=Thelephora ganbajun TaxID=370292 RepID=A0ACB6YYS2_THEGA|nr:hypothetical protein BDM02DRAFT_3176644 [Thelephora ganbajun]